MQHVRRFLRPQQRRAAVPHQWRGCATEGPIILSEPSPGHVEVRGWVRGVDHVEPKAVEQLRRIAGLADIVKHPVAAMPDLHLGNGVAVGAVIPTTQAIIPSAVGVDIGCGIVAVKTSLAQRDLPTDLERVRLALELAIPHGRTHNGRPENDAGGWRKDVPQRVANAWRSRVEESDLWSAEGRACGGLAASGSAATSTSEGLEARFKKLCSRRPELERANTVNHLGSLGSGNHFVELCLEVDAGVDHGDGADHGLQPVWLMIHSGSRGVGARIGSVFIEAAKRDMGALLSTIPDQELAYVREGTELFDEYVAALDWAQDFARVNRLVMMSNALDALRSVQGVPKDFTAGAIAVNCHHNYVERYTPVNVAGADTSSAVWLTRKGATSARKGELGIVPGSMGAYSHIVRGKGNAQSYDSCSHGAGRAYSRGEALRRFTLDEHKAATVGVCCRKDKDVVDETPAAYKPIAQVMAAQAELVDIVHTLRQVVCVKG